MNRMIKLFQQKSNRKFDEYLLAKKKSLSPEAPQLAEGNKSWPTMRDILLSTLKAESDCWAKAADLLRKEELSK